MASEDKGLPPRLDLRKMGVVKKEPSGPPSEATPQKPAEAPQQRPVSPSPVAAAKSPAGAAPVQGRDRAAPEPVTSPLTAVTAPGAAAAPEKPREAAPARPAAAAAAPVRPVPVGKPVDKPSEGAAPSPKKKTSRIPLEAARTARAAAPAQAQAQRPATIRIKPTATVSPVKPAAPAGEKEGGGAAADPATAEKRKTSRISLDAVLGPGGEGEAKPGEGGPKTIRLKRPGAPGAARIAPAAKAVKPTAAAQAAEDEAPTQVSEVVPVEEGATPTARKTVRVKRPDAAAKPAAAVARESGAGPAEAPALALSEAAADEPSWIFPLLTIAAVLVVIVTVYMFCSQVLGPNSCLTEHSYLPSGPELPWPGKISASL
ncbi:hypothetical protein ACFLSJ_07810 [Verrucomicrobiota bacterium]